MGTLAPGGVHLARGVGIAAHVVGGEVIGPHGHGGKLQHRAAQGVHQLGGVFQQHGDGGIAHVHGADAAVGVVLLGEEGHFSPGRGNELVGGEGLPPGRGAQVGIVRAAGLLRLPGQLLLQGLATGGDGVKALPGRADGVGDLRPVAAVPGLAQVAESN